METTTQLLSERRAAEAQFAEADFNDDTESISDISEQTITPRQNIFTSDDPPSVEEPLPHRPRQLSALGSSFSSSLTHVGLLNLTWKKYRDIQVSC